MSIITKSGKLPYLYLITVFCLTFLGIIYWPGMGFVPRYLAWIIGILMPIILCPSFFRQSSFVLFLFYALVVFLNYLGNDTYYSDMKKMIEEMVVMYIPMGMTCYAVKYRNEEWIRKVFVVAIFAVVWITTATAFFDAQIPGLVRTIQMELQNGFAEVDQYKYFFAIGLSNYVLPHSVPVLIPIFAIVLRYKGIPIKRKVLPLIILAVLMMLIYFSGATGPLLIAIVLLILSLWFKPGNAKTAIVSMVVFALIATPFLSNDDLMLALLQSIDDLLGNQGHFHSKVVSFQESILYGSSSGDVEGRQNLYLLDLEGFFENVLIGTQHEVGGHSVILARLGTLGLVGFIPFMAILYKQYKLSLKLVKPQYHIYYYLGSFGAMTMLLLKGIASWEIYFFWFTLLPFGIVSLDYWNGRSVTKNF